MSMQIAICDDSPEDIRKLSEALYAYNDSIQITEYSNGEFLVADCLEHENLFDILFLDIYMPSLSGIETASKIRSAMKDVIIIFVSSSNEHYPEAFEVFAFNYIIKPVNPEKLNNLMDQALMNMSKECRRQIQFTYKSKHYRIFCNDILYLESKDKIILFHMVDNTTMQCYAKLDEISKQLPEDSFIRTHQSFVVNIYHITEMSENHFHVGLSAINISKKYQKLAKDKYFDYLFTHMNGRGI
ncbi:MAG: LytTR family DNA-binding domain-containing protein [Lachnospiraceae bacterium]|nr:LytTR family DNA-binding domain-containing protein [Lachnospiraceae bacterium]